MSNVVQFRKMPPPNDGHCCMCGAVATVTLALVNLDDKTDVTKFFCSDHSPVHSPKENADG